eukprot:Partr_v1_DN25352_c2_g2_i3_m21767 putative specific peptidase
MSINMYDNLLLAAVFRWNMDRAVQGHLAPQLHTADFGDLLFIKSLEEENGLQLLDIDISFWHGFRGPVQHGETFGCFAARIDASDIGANTIDEDHPNDADSDTSSWTDEVPGEEHLDSEPEFDMAELIDSVNAGQLNRRFSMNQSKIHDEVILGVGEIPRQVTSKVEVETFFRLIHCPIHISREDNFPPLSSDCLAVVKSVMATKSETIVFRFNIEIKPADIGRLRNGQWLNDELVNFYLNMIKQRSEIYHGKRVHVFNTFFYPNLKDPGYEKVKRWTKSFDLFELDLVLFPVHLGMHWCCGCIDMKNKRIEYYDSLHGLDSEYFKIIRSYLQDEFLDKHNKVLDLSDWTEYVPKDIPAQMNGFDCGVFACI